MHSLNFDTKNQARNVLKATTMQNSNQNNNNHQDDSIDSYAYIEKVLFSRFALSVTNEINIDVKNESAMLAVPKDFTSLIQMINTMAKGDTNEVHIKGRRMLVNLFPSWLLPQYRWMFAKPFPKFSAWMNAWVTKFATKWLMGPSEVEDLILENGEILKQQSLKIEKCAFLEESQCVRTCLHACKIPTQDFFQKEMGLPVTLSPDFEDYSCEFKFGLKPVDLIDDPIFQSPCLQLCSSLFDKDNKKSIAKTQKKGMISNPNPVIPKCPS